MEQKEILEKFLLDNDELEKIEEIISEFNIYETMNISNAEIRHSYTLSWLMDPKGNHGLYDYFIRLFLKHLFSQNKNVIDLKITFFDFEILDLSDLEVRSEWNNIDILLISENNKLVITIENKIDSSEHSDQLKRYSKIINKYFVDYDKIFVFLTPTGDKPSDSNWLIMDYEPILTILEKIIKTKEQSISDGVLLLINHYAAILRRYIVNKPEIEEICRKIYGKHKEALDLIFQYKPDIYLQISKYIQEELISANPNLILDNSGKNEIKFTTKELDAVIPKKGEGWTPTKRMLLLYFGNNKERLDLRVYIGPGDQEIRKKLYNIATSNHDLFKLSQKVLSEKWLSIYQKIFLNEKDYEEPDFEKMKIKINKIFNEFMETDFKKILKCILDNFNHGT